MHAELLYVEYWGDGDVQLVAVAVAVCSCKWQSSSPFFLSSTLPYLRRYLYDTLFHLSYNLKNVIAAGVFSLHFNLTQLGAS